MIFFKLSAYIQFRIKAKPLIGHGIHSPFVYHLATDTLRNAKNYKIELLPVIALKNELAKSKASIPISSDELFVKNKQNLNIRKIVKKHLNNKKYFQLLYALVNEFKPLNIIETGSSFGLYAATMALASHGSKIISFEMNIKMAEIARTNYNKLGINNINQQYEVFPKILYEIKSPFLLTIGRNLTIDQTHNFIEQIFSQLSNGCIIILGSIHISPEREKLWNIIKQNNNVTISIDLYSAGLLFMREGTTKQDFWIRY
jgi:hypothetical protein